MKNYTLNSVDLKKIGKGALVAMAGALLTYAVQVVGQINFGVNTPLVVAVFGIIVNALSKVLDGQLGV